MFKKISFCRFNFLICKTFSCINIMNIYLFAFIIFVIFFLYSQIGGRTKTVENLDEGNGRYCENCNDLTFGQCIKCINCGYCGKKDSGKCVQGTFMGTKPEDKEKCTRWFQNDPFWRNINGLGQQKNIMTAYAL